MNVEECRRVLGIPPNASSAAVRQAYLDLARVWHPDRFHSDDRLRDLAQDRLREINEAYASLKNPRPPHTTPPSATRPRAKRPAKSRTVLAACALALPFLAALQLIPLLRPARLDADLLASRAWHPNILTPMRVIDARSDVRTASEALTQWARGDVIDLWKPSVYIPTVVPSAPAAARRNPVRSPSPASAITRPALPNGAELMSSVASGAGDMSIANHTSLEAVAKLVSDGAVRKALYIVPHGSVTLRSIPVGVYYLHVDLGKDLDAARMQFRVDGVTPTPLGPFQFLQITSEKGVSGNHYEVVLNPR